MTETLQRKNFNNFKKNLIELNSVELKKEWNLMSKEDKDCIKKEIFSLPKETQREIHLRLNLIGESLALEVMGYLPTPSKVLLDNQWYSAKEIRDNCIANIKYVPRFIIAIFSLKEIEQKSLLNDLRKVDMPFYNSVMVSLERLDRYTRETIKNKKSDKDFSKEKKSENMSKTPVTYLFQYIENKAELLSMYKNKLIEKGLTPEQAMSILEIESQLLGPETFQDENRNTTNTG